MIDLEGLNVVKNGSGDGWKMDVGMHVHTFLYRVGSWDPYSSVHDIEGGLRHRDHMSPFLFSLVEEAMGAPFFLSFLRARR